MKPPVSYFGGKRRWAEEVWKRFGDPAVYAEPFAGMLGVLLSRPTPPCREYVVDIEGLVCNFWRATKADPEGVFKATIYPAIQHDLIARRRACYKWNLENSDRLTQDPDWFDVKIAGWWAWGVNNSIMRIFTAIKPPAEGVGQKPTNKPSGLHALSITEEEARAWLTRLSQRLAKVTILGGDWSQAVADGYLYGVSPDDDCAVFLDPPYLTQRRDGTLYACDARGQSDDAAVQSYEWAIANGDKIKVAYCCAEGDFPCPEGWEQLTRRFRGGPNTSEEHIQTYREALFFSPACHSPDNDLLL